MQTSNKKISGKQKKAITQQFLHLISDLKTPDESQVFFDSFLTKTEQNVFIKRLAIMQLLDKGLSYKEIKKKLKVSSATISSVASQMKNQKQQVLIDKIKLEEWADKWANKLTNWLPR